MRRTPRRVLFSALTLAVTLGGSDAHALLMPGSSGDALGWLFAPMLVPLVLVILLVQGLVLGFAKSPGVRRTAAIATLLPAALVGTVQLVLVAQAIHAPRGDGSTGFEFWQGVVVLGVIAPLLGTLALARALWRRA
ncbi:MAG: hypothetical protein Q8Q09_01550 [Deltaproteobacteria bacterium]|nr:hypothetical protein [Deltaproteobacteria bacterium]